MFTSFLKALGLRKQGNTERLPELSIVASLLSDPGCHRDVNEDAGLIVNGTPDAGVLVVVADGMGGHQNGKRASLRAVEVLHSAHRRFRRNPGRDLAKAVQTANKTIYAEGERSSGERMGTTCTCLLLRNGFAHIAHVGDSRCYLIRGGSAYQMTEDHSVVRDLVKSGVLAPEEARKHPQRNVINRAVGTHPHVRVESWTDPIELKDKDTFVVCSDGLHDLLEPDEIRQIVTTQEPAKACRALIETAKARGGFDNITVAVATARVAQSQLATPVATREAEVLT